MIEVIIQLCIGGVSVLIVAIGEIDIGIHHIFTPIVQGEGYPLIVSIHEIFAKVDKGDIPSYSSVGTDTGIDLQWAEWSSVTHGTIHVVAVVHISRTAGIDEIFIHKFFGDDIVDRVARIDEGKEALEAEIVEVVVIEKYIVRVFWDQIWISFVDIKWITVVNHGL